jgi:hypothetical protein
MRLDEYQIANALIDTRLVMTSRLASIDCRNCHGRGRGFESRRPRHSFQALAGIAPFWRGHKKAQNRNKFCEKIA